MTVLTIAKYTFRELLKSKVVIASLWMGLALLTLTFVTSEFSYGNPKKIAMDFGLGGSSLVAVAISIFMGVSLIKDEVESRTAYMILSRPISRWQFLLGKLLGMSLILLINILVINFLSYGAYSFYGGSFQPLYLHAVFAIFLEALTMLSIVLLISLLANTTITVINSLVIFFAGHSIEMAMSTSFLKDNASFAAIVKTLSYFIPNFTKINLKPYVIYNNNLPTEILIKSGLYILIYIAAVICVSLIVFEKKELE